MVFLWICLAMVGLIMLIWGFISFVEYKHKYRWWNRLFGWHYVAVSHGGSHKVCKIHHGPLGIYCWLHDECCQLATTPRDVIPITFPKEWIKDALEDPENKKGR